MKHYVGSIPTKYTQKEFPPKFKADQRIKLLDESSSIGIVICPIVSQRTYEIVYKYLVKVDIDLYMFDESDLTDEKS